MVEGAMELVSYEEIDEARKRIVALLPAMANADEGTQLALAYLTMSYGLDPFMGDIWPIPKKVGGKAAGWDLMLGIRGLRKVAFRSGQYDGLSFRWLTEREAELLDLDAAKGYKAIACEVRRRDCSAPFVGFGVVLAGDTSKMNHGQLAKLRAERYALKLAFPLELPGVLSVLADVEIEVEAIDDRDRADGVVQDVTHGTAGRAPGQASSAAQNELDLYGEGD